MNNKRVMLKLSGEALSLTEGGYNDDEIIRIAKQVKAAIENSVQVGIVIGGGNYWRGKNAKGIDRTKADSIGMLATVMNCIYVSEIFRLQGIKTAVLSAFPVGTFTQEFSKDLAVSYMKDDTVVFLAGGTGHPYFSTDTGIVLRALELDVDIVLMAKNIDGVYDCDPLVYKDAKKIDKLSLTEMVEKGYEVIDLTASSLAKAYNMPIAIFSLKEEGSITAAMNGDIHGTIITAE